MHIESYLVKASCIFNYTSIIIYNSDCSIMKDLPKIYFPAVWIKQAASLDEDLGSLLRLISRLPLIGTILFYVILGIGVLLLCLVIFCVLYKSRKSSMILLKGE